MTDRVTVQKHEGDLDAEVTDQRPDPDEEPPKKLTRQERLQGLADAGCDTWEEYRGER